MRDGVGSLLLQVLAGSALPEARSAIVFEQASSSPGSMVGVGAGAHGFLGVSHIARETVNFCRVSCNKERAHNMQQCSFERGTLKM